MQDQEYKWVALKKGTYVKLRSLGAFGDSFDSIILKLLKNKNTKGQSQAAQKNARPNRQSGGASSG